jgi:hypothetical protein
MKKEVRFHHLNHQNIWFYLLILCIVMNAFVLGVSIGASKGYSIGYIIVTDIVTAGIIIGWFIDVVIHRNDD